MPGPDIFLSYNREDAAVAKLFADAFAREGLEVWWDQTLRSGETYDEVTEAALRGAKAVVVLWSPRSIASHWVRAEATIAHRAKTLVPATIEPCDKPVMFELTQTAELSHWRGEAGDSAWQAFLADVRKKVGKDPSDSMPAAPSQADGTAASRAGVPIVAVLPLSCRGGDEQLEFVCEDLSEEITRELVRTSQFKVTAAGIMAAWRGKRVDYRALGRELGVRYFAEGKLQRGEGSIRLTMQIIDAVSGDMPWSMRFSRKASELETSPEYFAAAVATELQEELLRNEVKLAIAKTGQLSSWEHMLRGTSPQTGFRTIHKQIEELRCAVAAAPEYGLAHARLASVLAVAVIAVAEELDEAIGREIQSHAAMALRLDGDNFTVIQDLVLAHAALGDFEVALRLARRAAELSPGSPLSYLELGFANEFAGHIAEAITAYEQQDRLSSNDYSRNNALANLGRCLCLEGRTAEAEEALNRSLALRPDFHSALKWKAIVAAKRGDEKAAIAAVKRLRAAEPNMPIERHVQQILFYARLADRLAEPVAILQRLWDATEGEPKAK